MSLRTVLVSLSVAGLAAAAHAQEAPVARTHVDDSAVLTAAPPPKPAATQPTSVASLQTTPLQGAGPQTTATGDETAKQIAEWLKADSSGVQPLDPHAEIVDGPAPRQIHGEVGAYVSNRGYGGYAATSVPLGQASELDLAVSGEHIHTRWGNANPRSIAVGLYLDGGDVGRWLSKDKCNVPRWGVSLPGDPQVLADGSCVKSTSSAQAAPGASR